MLKKPDPYKTKLSSPLVGVKNSYDFISWEDKAFIIRKPIATSTPS